MSCLYGKISRKKMLIKCSQLVVINCGRGNICKKKLYIKKIFLVMFFKCDKICYGNQETENIISSFFFNA